MLTKTKKLLFVGQCRNQIHIKCSDTSPSEYESLRTTSNWTCISCTIQKLSHIFPFTLEADEVLLGTNDTNLPSIVYLLSSLQVLSKVQNLPNLSDYDMDKKIKPDIDCRYYNVQEFQSVETSAKDISLSHMNIRGVSIYIVMNFLLL